MQTTIEWLKPTEQTPPFGKQFLALLGGQATADAGATWEKYVRVCNVVMKKESPNDDEPGEQYREFGEDDRGAACFDDYQFCLIEYHDHAFGDERDELDWYSDAIVRWAPMPDFSELLK
jgi:hypothetical protein